MTKGNAYFLDQKVNFDKERFDAVAYNSFYLGAAVDIDERLKLGLRLKYLTGIANLHTDNFHLGLETSSEFYQTTPLFRHDDQNLRNWRFIQSHF